MDKLTISRNSLSRNLREATFAGKFRNVAASRAASDRELQLLQRSALFVRLLAYASFMKYLSASGISFLEKLL
eukprot:4701874-Pleurochrysis_carterae.AAC.3